MVRFMNQGFDSLGTRIDGLDRESPVLVTIQAVDAA
jgi:hypothetical protein